MKSYPRTIGCGEPSCKQKSYIRSWYPPSIVSHEEMQLFFLDFKIKCHRRSSCLSRIADEVIENYRYFQRTKCRMETYLCISKSVPHSVPVSKYSFYIFINIEVDILSKLIN